MAGRLEEDVYKRQIYGSVNLQVKDEYDNDATINEVLGYGRIKLGLQITSCLLYTSRCV